MKIGILTFHRALNYGALLQAYALKKKLTDLGADAQIVDYRNDLIESMYYIKSFKECKGIKEKLHYFLTHRRDETKAKNFDSFRKEYLGLSNLNYYNSNTINKVSSFFDRFITGSDQVWNPKAHNFDKHFYLDFVSTEKKFSYAASFGEDIDPVYYNELDLLLQDYSICSVREKEGENIIHKINSTIVTRVDVDPVYLLSKEEWRKFFNVKKNSKKYALVYLFRLTEKTKEMIRNLYDNGYEIYYLGKPLRSPFNFKVKFIGSAGPKEFIELFYNSSYVVTNSFHGTSFSIIFNKPFALELFINTSRLENIVRLTGLESRIYDNNTNCDEFLNRNIDWNKVNSTMRSSIDNSVVFLKETITNEQYH